MVRFRHEPARQLPRLAQHIGIGGVIAPSSLSPVRDETRVLQNPKMKGEPRLRRVQRVRELADAALPAAEARQNQEPGLVGERVEEPGGAGNIRSGSSGHAPYYINNR